MFYKRVRYILRYGIYRYVSPYQDFNHNRVVNFVWETKRSKKKKTNSGKNCYTYIFILYIFYMYNFWHLNIFRSLFAHFFKSFFRYVFLLWFMLKIILLNNKCLVCLLALIDWSFYYHFNIGKPNAFNCPGSSVAPIFNFLLVAEMKLLIIYPNFNS